MSAPETATGARDWPEMHRLAVAAAWQAAQNVQRNRPSYVAPPASVTLDAQAAYRVWVPAIWVLAAATIVELTAENKALRDDIDDLTFELREATT